MRNWVGGGRGGLQIYFTDRKWQQTIDGDITKI